MKIKTETKILVMILIFITFIFTSPFTFSVSAQEKKKPAQQDPLFPGDEKTQTSPVEEIETGEFVYKPKGRRDPFWNLLRGKSVKIKREAREGIAGMLIDELVLEGIILKGRKFIALFKGPDGRPYDVKVGDSVYDGEVIKIDLNSVVFKRILTIALGGTKEKIIIKTLIPEEEASIK